MQCNCITEQLCREVLQPFHVMGSHAAHSAAGLGTDNLIKVECDATGCMLPEALDQALTAAKKEGKVRFPTLLTLPCTNSGSASHACDHVD